MQFSFFSSLVTSALLVSTPLIASTKPIAQDIEILEIEHQGVTSANYQLINRNEFIASAQNLSDILNTVNGIQIRQISGIGNPVSVSIRGSSTKQVQLYIDGQLVNDSQFGGFDLNQIPVEQIQSIEVSKSQAMGTGMTPIGGVIRVNTYNPSSSHHRVSVGLGSFGYREANITSNHKLQAHTLSYGGQFLESDNDYSYLVPQTFEDSSISEEQQLRNNQYEKIALYINDRIDLDAHNIRLSAQYSDQSKGIANYQNNSPQTRSTLDSDNWRLGFIHLWKPALANFNEVELEGYYEDKSEHYLSANTPVLSKDYFYDTTKRFVSIKPSFAINSFNVLPYVNYTHQNYNSEQFINQQASTCNGLSGCHIEVKLKQHNIGSRFEWQSSKLPLESYLLVNHLEERSYNLKANSDNPDKQEQDHSHTSYETGISGKVNKLKLDFSLSKGLRTPTLFELYGDRGTFKGNNNLAPEESKTYSLSANYMQSGLSAKGTVYKSTQSNAIVAIFNASGTGSYTNVSDAELLGLELQTNYQVTPNLALQLQTNFLDTQTHSEFVAFDDKKLPGIYHQQLELSLKYTVSPHWRLALNSSIDKELYFNRTNKFSNSQATGNGRPSDRKLTDVAITWEKETHTLAFKINNLLNKSYQDLANRPAQGRSIQLKYSIKGL